MNPEIRPEVFLFRNLASGNTKRISYIIEQQSCNRIVQRGRPFGSKATQSLVVDNVGGNGCLSLIENFSSCRAEWVQARSIHHQVPYLLKPYPAFKAHFFRIKSGEPLLRGRTMSDQISLHFLISLGIAVLIPTRSALFLRSAVLHFAYSTLSSREISQSQLYCAADYDDCFDQTLS